MRLIPFPVSLLRALFVATVLALSVLPASGQAPAIEPCPATPVTKTGAAPVKVEGRRILIDESISDDRDVEKVLSTYTEKVHALSLVIGRLDGELKKTTVGGGTLGNFVTDGIRTQATVKLKKPVAVAIMNSGGMRKNVISPGELRASDIFELLPFENALIAIDFTGAQLLKVLQVAARDAQSGAKIQFKWNDQDRIEFLSARLLDANGKEVDIDPEKTYTVVTIDYLVSLGSGPWNVLHEGTNQTPLNVTLREVMMDYVKSQTAAGRAVKSITDERFVQVGPGPKTERPND